MCVNLFIKNRLIAIDDKIEYQYDNNNRRVSKTVNGTTIYFIYKAHKLMGEYDKDGNIIKEYFYFGNTPIAMIDSIDIYNIYSDHLSTPRRVTNSKNKTVWKWESTPFGETAPTGSLEFNLRFAGQYYDNETGTHYNINRDYNPVTGRYIQSDPIGLDGGFSTFVYVNGNPVMLVDLEGLFLASQNAPTPTSSIDRKNIYLAMMKRFKSDLYKAYYVADDIRNNIKFTQGYTQDYTNSSPGYESRAVASGIRAGISGYITYYRSTWENSDGSLRRNNRTRFLQTAFHELQHLRRTNNIHPKPPYRLPHPFDTEFMSQVGNFMVTADGNYWGQE